MIRRPPRSTLFPTRRSSDLGPGGWGDPRTNGCPSTLNPYGDRKSTRLNSSHGYISYAVFCLKKKKIHNRFFNEHTRKIIPHAKDNPQLALHVVSTVQRSLYC